MFNDAKYFINFSPREDEVILADGSSIKTLGTGTIHLDLPHSYLKIKNGLLIPQLSVNLLSMATFIQANHTIRKSTSSKSFEVIGPNHEIVIEGSLESGNFVVTQIKATAFSVNFTSQIIMRLQQASGHPSYKYFKQMYSNRQIPHLDFSTSNTGKMTKIPFKGNFPTCHHKLEFLNLDLCGPISPASVSGSKYFLRIFHSFGCEATSLILPTPSELNQEGKLGILIGYGEGHQTYRILNLETGNVKISHHVKFNNNIFHAFSYLDSNKTETFTISDNSYLPFINPNVKISNISHATEENPTQISNTLADEESEIPIQPIDHDLPIESTALKDNATNQLALPKYKGYIWTNKPIDQSKEIIGEVGNPRNILDTSRRPKHSAKFSELTLLDPKTKNKQLTVLKARTGKKVSHKNFKTWPRILFGHHAMSLLIENLSPLLGFSSKKQMKMAILPSLKLDYVCKDLINEKG
ncbi:hypothetical protein O181_008742 [Austropuccinia psidii MF-1]|uniref:Uncharacterized protein n=1 Tax=Austropuccinia psidii MF-1 TaxID=1389203 RepID=A0A9Q3BPD8_9BASI|nr:hypothetical protein [Austropuccinia psidii MF-1]